MDLRFPAAQSLKARRSIVRPLVEGARRRFAVAVAETAHHDSWQRAEVSFAALSAAPARVTETLDALERFVWSFPEVEVLAASRHWVEIDAPG